MNGFVNRLAYDMGLAENVIWVLGAILLVLIVGSIIRLGWLLASPSEQEKWRDRAGSLLTWWILFVLLAVVVLVGGAVAAVLFALVSLLGLREFRRLASKRIATEPLGWVCWAVPVHYFFAYLGWFGAFWTFIPVWVFLLLLIGLAVKGETGTFLERAGITFVGMMLIVFLLSHVVLIFALPDAVNPVAGAAGLFVYLLVLTEINDIAQALWGRQFGKRKITPKVSPNKTWGGFLFGAATTIALAVALAPLLTPFADQPISVGQMEWHLPYLPALAAGVLIAVGGFLGDITMSAIKREVAVKESGTLLPGQGGMLDRIDSLTFTAPVFFYFVYLLYVC